MNSITLRRLVRASMNREITGMTELRLCDVPKVQATAPIVVQSGTINVSPVRYFTLSTAMGLT